MVIPPEEMERAGLTDGAEVEVRPAGDRAEHRYATVSEALKAFDETEQSHANTYRELAK